jgi:hypothetical protein
MKTALLRTALIFSLTASLSPAALAQAQQVSLTMNNGRVTLKTTNATVRQILQEWARVGGTTVVNAEKINSQPVSLTLIDVPEGQALETVLRSAAGYIVAEKQNATATGSRYERIMLLARSTPVNAPGGATSASAGPAAFNPANPAPPGGTVENQVAEDDGDPPAPTAPVINPYAQGVNANANNGVPGMGTGLGSQMNQGQPGQSNQAQQPQQGMYNATPGYTNVYGSQNANAANAATNPGTAGVVNNPPETKFDYANPQKYFQQQQQNGTAQNPSTMQPYPGVPLAGTNAGATNTTNTNTSTPAGTGAAGAVNPTTPTNTPQNFNPYSPNFNPNATGNGAGNVNPYSPNFNPYNLPAGQGVPGATSATPQQSVEPDRAKYANPYVQPANPPQN